MKKQKNASAANKMSQATTQLLLQEPFFGALAMRLELIEDESIKTECTNGKYIRYNPNFINSLTHEQVKSEIIHEVCHSAKLHPFRQEGRDNEIYNQACDYVINLELKDASYKLDETWLLDVRFKGMSEEQVYTVLEQEKQKNQQQGQRQGQGEKSSKAHGQVEQATNAANESAIEQEQNWKSAVLQAAQQAQKYGELPGFVKALVDEIKNPRNDWRAELRKFLETTARNDFTWTRPSTRFMALGVYMPSVHSEKLPPICIYWDTSGSRWSSQQVAYAGAEVASIIADARPERTVVIYGDTRVTKVDVFEEGDVVKFDPKGGGGTDFRPIFEYIEKEGIEPCCLIGITDLEGSFPTTAPSYPVIWCCDERGKSAPFGEVIHVRMD